MPKECDEGTGLAVKNDIWYRYTPPSSGTLTVSTCNQASYDTRLAAYTGACGGLELVACNDNGERCARGTSLMEVPVTGGVPVLIRVGASGDVSGTGRLTLTLAACASDLDGSGAVDFGDILRILTDWGPCK